MALIIKSDNLYKDDGTLLPNDNVLVKFVYESNWDGYDLNHKLKYYTNVDAKHGGWADILIIYKTDDKKQYLPTQFVRTQTMQDIMATEQLVEQLMAGQPTSIKTIFAHHYFVKQELEKILGENTVDIRIDVQ